MKMPQRCLITGATGLLAPYIILAARAHYDVVTTARSSGDQPCDLTDPASTSAMIEKVSPDLVVHAAGMTDVDQCEREPKLAWAVNSDATANLASQLRESTRLIVISTDQVYPDRPGPHPERASGPINVYGKSKLAGERMSLEHPTTLVLRTNFFGPSLTPHRSSLSDFVTEALRRRRAVTFFNDILFSPLHMSTVAELIFSLAGQDIFGVFNAGCRDGRSKADFAFAIARHLHLSTQSAVIDSSSSLPGRAPRPSDLRLDVTRLEGTVGRPMPSFEDEVAKL